MIENIVIILTPLAILALLTVITIVFCWVTEAIGNILGKGITLVMFYGPEIIRISKEWVCQKMR